MLFTRSLILLSGVLRWLVVGTGAYTAHVSLPPIVSSHTHSKCAHPFLSCSSIACHQLHRWMCMPLPFLVLTECVTATEAQRWSCLFVNAITAAASLCGPLMWGSLSLLLSCCCAVHLLQELYAMVDAFLLLLRFHVTISNSPLRGCAIAVSKCYAANMQTMMTPVYA
ncbi:hypothetical protein ABL78_5985 [Leptomonas seymouri]|uniref:Secreted protein n=1 Tax=Leptomonas seymouri TaxID=5684 RepID=A0A0N1PC78_LEPSE|nr:hypothetical protein ABL78_5985 [Leptomonas seymouri]|eukprot:KPI84970.1 hypothetical protein ABL78_5985 [Leptomonas seymouri]